jgi:hypothetical protein
VSANLVIAAPLAVRGEPSRDTPKVCNTDGPFDLA